MDIPFTPFAPFAPSPEIVESTIQRAFGGDRGRMRRFARTLRRALPPGTRVVIRGSAVAGQSYRTGRPFDADGPGSSDLDIVLLGPGAMALFEPDAFYVPGVNSKPLCDGERWVAPALDDVRAEAQELVHRPVAIQAMADWFLELRAIVQGQPHMVLDDVPG
jgi:hypothetical protein